MECKGKEINFGLDLKGGMNLVLEVKVSDVVKALSGHNTDPVFNQAIDTASATASQARPLSRDSATSSHNYTSHGQSAQPTTSRAPCSAATFSATNPT